MIFYELINVFDSKDKYKLLKYPFTIGRSPQADLKCKNGNVSKRHAQITLDNGKLYINDSSLNGTFINDEKVESNVKVRLRPDEEIAFGASRELINVANTPPPYYVFVVKFQAEELERSLDSNVIDLRSDICKHQQEEIKETESKAAIAIVELDNSNGASNVMQNEFILDEDPILISDDDMNESDMVCSQLFMKVKTDSEQEEGEEHMSLEESYMIKHENLEAELYEFNWPMDEEDCSDEMKLPNCSINNNNNDVVSCEVEEYNSSLIQKLPESDLAPLSGESNEVENADKVDDKINIKSAENEKQLQSYFKYNDIYGDDMEVENEKSALMKKTLESDLRFSNKSTAAAIFETETITDQNHIQTLEKIKQSECSNSNGIISPATVINNTTFIKKPPVYDFSLAVEDKSNIQTMQNGMKFRSNDIIPMEVDNQNNTVIHKAPDSDHFFSIKSSCPMRLTLKRITNENQLQSTTECSNFKDMVSRESENSRESINNLTEDDLPLAIIASKLKTITKKISEKNNKIPMPVVITPLPQPAKHGHKIKDTAQTKKKSSKDNSTKSKKPEHAESTKSKEMKHKKDSKPKSRENEQNKDLLTENKASTSKAPKKENSNPENKYTQGKTEKEPKNENFPEIKSTKFKNQKRHGDPSKLTIAKKRDIEEIATQSNESSVKKAKFTSEVVLIKNLKKYGSFLSTEIFQKPVALIAPHSSFTAGSTASLPPTSKSTFATSRFPATSTSVYISESTVSVASASVLASTSVLGLASTSVSTSQYTSTTISARSSATPNQIATSSTYNSAHAPIHHKWANTTASTSASNSTTHNRLSTSTYNYAHASNHHTWASRANNQNAIPDSKTTILIDHNDFVTKIFNWRIEFFVQPEAMNIVDLWPKIAGTILTKMANGYERFSYYKEAMQNIVLNDLVSDVHRDYQGTVYHNSHQKMYAFSGRIERVKLFPTHTEISCYTYLQEKQQGGKSFITVSNLLSFTAQCGEKAVIRTQFGIVARTNMSKMAETEYVDSALVDSYKTYPTHKLAFLIIARKDTPVKENVIIGCRYFTSLHKTFNNLYAIKKVEFTLGNYLLSPQPSLYQLPAQQPQILHIEQMPNLNEKQAAVVADAINLCKPSTEAKLLLIEGPPGTGKSFVIIHIILQILLQNPTEKPAILLLAQSNVAIDHLICKMKEVRTKLPLAQQKLIKMMRIGQRSATSPEASPYHIDNHVDCNMRTNLFRISPNLQHDYDQLSKQLGNLESKTRSHADEILFKKKREEYQNFVKNHYLHNYQKEVHKLRDLILSNANLICSTIGSCNTYPNHRFNVNFKCCIIDEASQATEPDTLLPLMLGIDKFILVGDTKQLPAHNNLVPKDYLFGRSLFERLHLNLQGTENNLIKTMDIQYRMVPEICNYPNLTFYDGRLVNFYTQTPNLDLRNLVPYAVLEHFPEGQRPQTYVNQSEINIVLSIISLINCHIKPQSAVTIGIITPYNDQKIEVIKRLKALRINTKIKITCNTIDSFQGREEDIVIFTLVRNTANRFVNDCQRLNVALTRAKTCLYIIASNNLYKSSPLMQDLYQDAVRRAVRHCITGPDLNLRRYIIC